MLAMPAAARRSVHARRSGAASCRPRLLNKNPLPVRLPNGTPRLTKPNAGPPPRQDSCSGWQNQALKCGKMTVGNRRLRDASFLLSRAAACRRRRVQAHAAWSAARCLQRRCHAGSQQHEGQRKRSLPSGRCSPCGPPQPLQRLIWPLIWPVPRGCRRTRSQSAETSICRAPNLKTRSVSFTPAA